MNATERVLSSSKIDEIVLLNVSFLGGTDLWISSEGGAVCRFVSWTQGQDSYREEVRYSFRVPESDLASLKDLIREHSFFDIETKDRVPVPDEARPTIYVKAGDTVGVVCKWARDTHSDFDPIHLFLHRIALYGRDTGTEVGRGKYDWAWEPDGFAENEYIKDMCSSSK